ncbi:MAG: acetyl-CoA carboxylase biotin carboxyl carrier protein subunit [Rivihabitans pingtungensis]
MPGRVVALLAPLGEAVEKGAPLMILEAMKMEHTLVAPGRAMWRRITLPWASRSAKAATCRTLCCRPP